MAVFEIAGWDSEYWFLAASPESTNADAIQPCAHPWDRSVPIPKQSLLDRLELLSKTLLDGPPFHGELAIPMPSTTDVGQAWTGFVSERGDRYSRRHAEKALLLLQQKLTFLSYSTHNCVGDGGEDVW